MLPLSDREEVATTMSAAYVPRHSEQAQDDGPGKGEAHRYNSRIAHSPEHTAIIIERERVRSDRTGFGFSLLLMRHGDTRRLTAGLTQVASYLSSRLRLTDELGWLE